MTDTLVFDTKPNEQTKPDQTPVDILEKRINDKDVFIEQLKSENAQMRQLVANADKAIAEVNALKDEIEELKKKSVVPQPREHTASVLTETDIEALIAKSISKRELDQTATQNIREANDEMIKLYGAEDKAREVLKQRAQELGLTVDQLKDVAVKSPTAFKRLVSEVQSKDHTLKIEGRVNTQALHLQSGGSLKYGTKAYFDDMRKKIGNAAFFKPEIQQQVIKAMESGTYGN